MFLKTITLFLRYSQLNISYGREWGESQTGFCLIIAMVDIDTRKGVKIICP